MTFDQIEMFGHSRLQHGPANDRVYLMKLDRSDFPQIIGYINGLALLHNYTKTFVKVPAYAGETFRQDGYRVEAQVPGLFRGCENGLFMARYFHPDRLIDHSADQVQQILEAARSKAGKSQGIILPEGSRCRLATPTDSAVIARLYAEVFASYPFPIQDPDYVAKTMNEDVIYAGIWQDGRLLAVASAEIDHDNSHAEMTDFATHPEWRGRGLATALLNRLEEELVNAGTKTCYTIARANSFGMNICFSRNGYQFGGTLTRNTQIAGNLESMNVWYKPLTDEAS